MKSETDKQIIRVSIIIPTYNRARLLRFTINSICKQTLNTDEFEVLVLDNGSTDNTKEITDKIIKDHQKHNIRYIYEPEPGLLSGRHRGAVEAKGDILVFVDDDIEADMNWLSAIYETFKDPEVHLVGGKNLPRYEVKPLYWLKYMWSSTPYGGKECGYLSLLELGDKVREIDPNYVWGLNFSIRKKTLFELGGFHPDCIPKHLQRFQGDGETGLTMKIREKGYKAIYQPCALVYHVISSERMTISYFERRMFYQGVCDSFSEIRKVNGITMDNDDPAIVLQKKSFSGKLKNALFLAYKKPTTMKEVILRKIYLMFNKELKSILDKLDKAYREGFQFHQNEVQNDPKLLQWVLKKDFFDYRLPE